MEVNTRPTAKSFDDKFERRKLFGLLPMPQPMGPVQKRFRVSKYVRVMSQSNYTTIEVTECILRDLRGEVRFSLLMWPNTTHLSRVRVDGVAAMPRMHIGIDGITLPGYIYPVPVAFAKRISILTDGRWGGEFPIVFIANATRTEGSD
jgi:hypothetical protein